MNNSDLTFPKDGNRLMRRVQGFHDLRLDGISDLLHRARGATVLDIGCNRGAVCDEFARNDAARVIGLDNYEVGIETAKQWFVDKRACPHVFKVVDLTGGETAIRAVLGADADLSHDFVLMLATYHKLKRVMSAAALSALMQYLGTKTSRYFGWRGYAEEIPILDADLGKCGLQRVQTSIISDIQPAAIWARLAGK